MQSSHPSASRCQGDFLSSAASHFFFLLRTESRALHMLGKQVTHIWATSLNHVLLKQNLTMYSRLLPQLSHARITQCSCLDFYKLRFISDFILSDPDFICDFPKGSVEGKSNDILILQKTDGADVAKPSWYETQKCWYEPLCQSKAESETEACLQMVYFWI